MAKEATKQELAKKAAKVNLAEAWETRNAEEWNARLVRS